MPTLNPSSAYICGNTRVGFSFAATRNGTGGTLVQNRISSGTDANHQGDVIYFGSGDGFTPGTIRHYKSDGSWEAADADAVAPSPTLLA